MNNMVIDNSKQDGHGMNTSLLPTTGDAYDSNSPAGKHFNYISLHFLHDFIDIHPAL